MVYPELEAVSYSAVRGAGLPRAYGQPPEASWHCGATET